MSSSYFGRILELLLRDVISKPPVYLYVPRFNHGSRCVRIVCMQDDQDSLAPTDNYWPSHKNSDCFFFRSVGMSAFVRADFCKMSYSEYLLKSVDTSGIL